MSTIGSLMLALGQSTPTSYGDIQAQTASTRGQELGNETALLKLAALKRSQASEQELMAAIQQDPALARLFFGDSLMGSLGQAPGGPPGGMPGAAPPPGPITQSPLGGGPAQQIPAYPDASRYAQVSPQGGGPIPPDVAAQGMPTVTPPGGAPGPVLASLGPGQGPPQGPQNPVLAMAARDPRAAMMLQQQIQGQQDRQWKMQEQRLDWGVKTAEYVARMIGNVKDQAGLDEAREQIRQVHPQAAAQMPQIYSKEAVASVQQRGIAVADYAKTQLDLAKAEKARMEAQTLLQMSNEAERLGQPLPAGPPGTPTPGGQVAPAPPEFESAITEAHRLYPQVSTTRIKSIIGEESRYDPTAVSPAGAQGLMQLMPGTAKDMGVDDPFNVQQNVRGGTRYYAQMLTRYGGNERKALTAYNWGPKNLDDVGGDVTKAPAATQAYVNRVLGGGAGGPGSGGTAPTQTPALRAQIADLDVQIKRAELNAQRYGMMDNAAAATQQHNIVSRLQEERNHLLEPGRALEKQTVLQPGALAQQRAGAEVQLEAEMNKPIGTENAIKMDLPAETKWKDVPKGTKVLDRPGEGMAAKFGDYKASHEGIARVLGMLEKPGAQSIIGTLFSEPDASFRRRAGEWVSSVTPEERKFAAAMVAEIASIRHALAGSAVSPEEAAFVKDMMPKTSDPDVGTVRAKLEVLQEWVARKHEGMRSQAEEMKIRAPKALPQVASYATASGLTPAQEALLRKHTTR